MNLRRPSPRLPHTILLVEDDLAMARLLVGALEASGFECIHVTTLEALRAAIDEARRGRHRFCAVILDMQFPLEDGKEPSVGSGLSALAELREYDGRKLPPPSDVHHLPIIIATAFSRDLDFTFKLGKKGADEFIPKPFGDRIDKVIDVVRSALGDARREDHAACVADREEQEKRASGPDPRHGGEAVEAARPGAAPAPPSASARRDEETPRAAAVRLVFAGVISKGTSTVTVNGTPFPLQNLRFATLLAFASAHERAPHDWHDRVRLGFDNDTDHPSRIAKTLKPALPAGFVLFMNAAGGKYKLNPDVQVEVAWEAYADHGTEKVKKIATEALARRARAGAGTSS